MTQQEYNMKLRELYDEMQSTQDPIYSEKLKQEVKDLNSQMLNEKNKKSEPIDETEEIIKDRKKQYGSYEIFTSEMLQIMNLLRNRRARKEGVEKTELDIEDVDNFFLVLKLLRKQTSEDKDSILDLENYARLIKEARY